MMWKKKGLIFCPDGSRPWADNSALTPTPWRIDDDTIRIFVSMRDKKGVGRIGYVDVDVEDPSRVRRVSEEPVLDIGLPGTFDDNGVILGDVVEHEGKLRMYYVGFQHVDNVKFLAFSGLALSKDKGESFQRFSKAPVLGRRDDALYINAIHSAIFENEVWKVWCGVGSGWAMIDGKPYPRYDIRYYESKDGIHFPDKGIVCIENTEEEYRIGRPRVLKNNGIYQMFYTKGTLHRDYLPGFAESKDGISWVRKDNQVGIALSKEGWDSMHLSYPALIRAGDKLLMFYNGNDMGKTGFGYAELIER
jgi:hypothetical protein